MTEVKCANCGVNSIYAKGICHKCYSRKYYNVKNPRIPNHLFVCKSCGTNQNKKTQTLCKQCYNKNYYKKYIKKLN